MSYTYRTTSAWHIKPGDEIRMADEKTWSTPVRPRGVQRILPKA